MIQYACLMIPTDLFSIEPVTDMPGLDAFQPCPEVYPLKWAKWYVISIFIKKNQTSWSVDEVPKL